MKGELDSIGLPSARIAMSIRQLAVPSRWTSASGGRLRLAKAGASALGMAIAKILQAAVTIVTVPLMLTYLGKEAYGLTMAIVGFSMLFCVGAGVFEGVKLRLIECFARGDKTAAQAYISTGFFCILPLVAATGILLMLVFPFVDWIGLFNVSEAMPASHETLRCIVAISLVSALALIPLSLLKEVYTAAQQGYVFSFFSSIGTVLSLAAIYIATWLDLGMVGIVLSLQGAMLAGYIGIWGFTCTRKFNWALPRWSLISGHAFRAMWHDCAMTVFLATGFMVINGTDIVVVNHYLGQSAAATYSVSIRFFIYVEVLLSFLLYPLWPALGEAVQNGEREWVRRMSARLFTLVLGGGSALFLAVILVGRPVIAFWTQDMIQPSLAMHLLMGMYYALRAITAVYATLLRAYGRIRLQSVAQCCEAVLHVILCVLLVQRIGLSGVVLGGIVSIVATQMWALPLEYSRVRRDYWEGV